MASSITAAGTPAQEQQHQRPHRSAAFLVLAAGIFLANLDLFVVNVAVPSIGREFAGTPLTTLSWVLNAYTIVYAALLIVAGRIADRTSPRAVYLSGAAAFSVGSLAAAAAPSIGMLIAARVAQAAGAAMMTPTSLGLLLASTPVERRGSAVRLWSAVAAVAATLGTPVGGVLTAVSWRWAFVINLPICLAVLLAGPRLLPRTQRNLDAARPDLAGAVLFSLAIGALALGVVEFNDWSAPRLLVVFFAAASAAVLAAVRTRRVRNPLVPPELLRIRPFAVATLATAVYAVAFAAMILSLSLWCQNVWHWSALQAGLAIAPGPLMVPFLAVGAGPLAARYGSGKVAAAGSLLLAFGAFLWVWQVGGNPNYLSLLPGMIVTGLGVGLTMPTLMSAAAVAVPAAQFATGSGVLTMARQIGSVVGVSALVLLLGHPHTAAQSVSAFHAGWTFVVAGALLTGLLALVLVPVSRRWAVAVASA